MVNKLGACAGVLLLGLPAQRDHATVAQAPDCRAARLTFFGAAQFRFIDHAQHGVRLRGPIHLYDDRHRLLLDQAFDERSHSAHADFFPAIHHLALRGDRQQDAVLVQAVADAAEGLSTSIPVSSTKVVVTMKKIRRMNTMSINGEILMSVTSSVSVMARRYFICFHSVFFGAPASGTASL